MATSPTIDTIPTISTDPFAAEVLNDPYPFFATLRDAGPIVWLAAHGTYGSGQFAAVEAIFKDPEHFRSSAGAGMSDIRKPGAWRVAGPIVEADPPEHTRIRKVLTQIISPRVIRGWKETFFSAAEALCDELVERGDMFDGVSDFAELYVLSVFPEALGIVVARENLVIVGNHNFNSIGPANDLFQRSQAALDGISSWFTLSQQREAMVPGGFGEAIFEAEERGDLPADTASPLIRTFLRGGMDTTISGIGSTLRFLAENPELLAIVKADPARLLNLFEESIRLESPAQTMFRTTAPQGVEFCGYTLAGDTKVQLFPGAGNRDPRKWDNPDSFDITRKPGMHAAFGLGIHNCIGRMIAQMEAECLIGALVRRVSHIELAGEPRIRPNNALRTLDTLPVRFKRT